MWKYPGRDPLGSRLPVVGRERDEDGGVAAAGVLMRGWRIYAWTVVIDCALTQLGPVLRIHRYSKFKRYNYERASAASGASSFVFKGKI